MWRRRVLQIPPEERGALSVAEAAEGEGRGRRKEVVPPTDDAEAAPSAAARSKREAPKAVPLTDRAAGSGPVLPYCPRLPPHFCSRARSASSRPPSGVTCVTVKVMGGHYPGVMAAAARLRPGGVIRRRRPARVPRRPTSSPMWYRTYRIELLETHRKGVEPRESECPADRVAAARGQNPVLICRSADAGAQRWPALLAELFSCGVVIVAPATKPQRMPL